MLNERCFVIYPPCFQYPGHQCFQKDRLDGCFVFIRATQILLCLLALFKTNLLSVRRFWCWGKVSFNSSLYFIAISHILFAFKNSGNFGLFPGTWTFITCIFLYHTCSCHYGLFHNGVLSCIFFDMEILYSNMHSIRLLSLFSPFDKEMLWEISLVSPATSSPPTFDLGSDLVDTSLLPTSSTICIS